MTWVLLIGAVWLSVAAFVGVLIGRGVRLADRKEEEAAAGEAASPNFVVDPLAPALAGPPVPTGTAPADPLEVDIPETEIPATTEPSAAERTRHSIPTARPAAVRAPIRSSERTPTHRDSGLY
jgi:hypothetical protein